MAAKRRVAVGDAGAGHTNKKQKLSDTRKARFNHRRSPLQLEMANATRLFERQLERAQAGSSPSLKIKGQKKTREPRRWCLAASLFGGSSCHPMYVLGALQLAASLPSPWALWLAVDRATKLAWEDLLSAAANIHLVVVDQPVEVGLPNRRKPGRQRWEVNTFTRFLLLDDPCLAGAVVGDLDVSGDAALKHLKLWKQMDATCDTDADIAYGVVSYPVAPYRAMLGRRTTWNGGAVAVAKRRVCSPDFAGSIHTFIGDKADTLEYGCDETWLGGASPIWATYRGARGAVLELTDGSGKEAPTLPGSPSRPQAALFTINDRVLTRTLGVDKCRAEAQALAEQLRRDPKVEHLRAVHALLTSPSSREYVVGWARNTGRHANML